MPCLAYRCLSSGFFFLVLRSGFFFLAYRYLGFGIQDEEFVNL